VRNYPEIKAVYLMSGGFDLMLMMEGRTMREIAYFVAEKLATIEGVTSTATHFVLQKYKDNGISFEKEKEDKRGNTW
jgi:DNA-binding Lrp family transcriptional regulator